MTFSKARLAGVCYLLVIVGGVFAEGVRSTVDDPADSPTLWRLALAVHLLYLIPALAVNVLVAELLKPVQPTLARLALAFGLVAVAIEGMSLLLMVVPLESPDRVSVSLFPYGFGLSLAFFAEFCVLVGVLLLRSRTAPRLIGGLMVVAGVCYLINTLAFVLSSSGVPVILVPCLIAELSFALWLVIKAPVGFSEWTRSESSSSAVTAR
jgi:hypothetical protein